MEPHTTANEAPEDRSVPTSTSREETSKQVKPCPVVAWSNQPEIDQASLDCLMTSAYNFAERRGSQGPNGRQSLLWLAVCRILVLNPAEYGVVTNDWSLYERTLADLKPLESDDIPEAALCRGWLELARGEALPTAREQFAALASQQLWNPVQALAHRSMTQLGLRRSLSSLLPKVGPLSLEQADAYLDASHESAPEDDWVERIVLPDDDTWPLPLCEKWRALILAEAALAQGNINEVIEATLITLSSSSSAGTPGTFAEAETQRLVTRAVAAVARTRLARHCRSEEILNNSASNGLPPWERMYLRALQDWQRGQPEAAIAKLEATVALNPFQTAARLALASLVAVKDPELALNQLNCDEPTFEILEARATILARLGRYDESRKLLAHEESTIGFEALRLSWEAGRKQNRLHLQALMTGLAEQGGDWIAADKAWRLVATEHRGLVSARHAFAAQQELKTLAAGQNWRRSLITQKLERKRRESKAVTLNGDGLFFRALSLASDHPEQSCRDLQELLTQENWIKREQDSGGSRLITAGDTLLRNGELVAAKLAYDLVPEVARQEACARVVMANLLLAIRDGKTAAISQIAADNVVGSGDSYWSPVIACLGLLASNVEVAQEFLELAEQRGAPESLARVLYATTNKTEVSEDDLSSLQASPEIVAALRLIHGTESEKDRLDSFTQTLGAELLSFDPSDSRTTTAKLLTRWCELGQWDEALKTAHELLKSDKPWSHELASLVIVRHALMLATKGDLVTAEEELNRLAKS